jgi:hypothetical protein
VYYGQRVLQRPGEEATLLRFTIQRDGSVSGLGTLAKKLVAR